MMQLLQSSRINPWDPRELTTYQRLCPENRGDLIRVSRSTPEPSPGRCSPISAPIFWLRTGLRSMSSVYVSTTLFLRRRR